MLTQALDNKWQMLFLDWLHKPPVIETNFLVGKENCWPVRDRRTFKMPGAIQDIVVCFEAFFMVHAKVYSSNTLF
jgi:hypothetical protein